MYVFCPCTCSVRVVNRCDTLALRCTTIKSIQNAANQAQNKYIQQNLDYRGRGVRMGENLFGNVQAH